MAQPKSPTDDEAPDALRLLVDQLARLRVADRDRIVHAVPRAACERRRTVSWSHLRDARGIARFGGGAVTDTQAL